MVVGGLDAQGKPTVMREPGGSNGYQISKEMMEDEKTIISQAFLMDIYMKNLDGRDRVTATEIMRDQQQENRLLSPLGGRSETESLKPMIDRELEIAERRGLLPEPPPLLVEAEGEYEVIFTSRLSLAQKSEQAIGAINWVERLLPLAEFSPEVLDRVNFDEYAEITHEAEGVPMGALRSGEEVEQIRAQRELG